VKQKHILFIVENNPALRDRRVFQEMTAAQEFGLKVSVISPKGDRKEFFEIPEGINLYEHPKLIEGKGILGLLIEYCNAFLWEYVFAIWIFLTSRYDIIHAANPPDYIFAIALPFKLFGVKFIFDHHDICPEYFDAKFGRKGMFFRILLWMEWFSFKTADVVISTNQSYREIAIKRGGKNPRDVFIVRNGPNLERLPAIERNESLKDNFRYLVGYVGIIAQQEGVDNLLRSIDHIVNRMNRKDIKFVIVGKGPSLSDMVDLSRKMSLERFVTFTGYIPDSELYEILSTSDVCVNPEFRNKFTDRSTMIKIMEYMTVGAPILQYYTVEGHVTAGKSADYVMENSVELFAEQLISLIQDREKRLRMSREGRERIETTLSWNHQKKHLRDSYLRILSQGIY